MPREHNWSDNYTFTAPRMHRPATLDALRRLVASASSVRAVGTRHSFNGIADSDGDMIDLSGMAPDFVIDRERMTVTLGANVTYAALAVHLQEQGCALHNMASLPHISVAGAVATGTHGSGDCNGNLATAVAALELVAADGAMLRIARGDPGFDGMVVGLGAFGIVFRITLDIQPSYAMRQDAFVALPWERLLGDFDAVMSSADSVNLLTRWGGAAVERMWLKTRLTDGKPRSVTAAHLGAVPGPASQIAVAGDAPSDRLNPFGGVPGPWHQRLPHFRADRQPGVLDQIQSEYMVPRGNAVRALSTLRGIADAIDPHLHLSEIRSMAADDLWLSPSQGDASVGIHFTWRKTPAEVDAITRIIEDRLLPLGARPHWGKLLHAGADRLAPLYPRMADFRALADRHDPTGKFRNAYLATHVFGK